MTTPDTVNLYSVSDTNIAPRFMDAAILPTDNANTLFMGAIDFGTNVVFALDSNNGLVAYDVVTNTGAIVPTIVANPPKTQTVRVGRSATFAVTAAGSSPLAYYWYFRPAGGEETLITTATTATNRINAVQLTDAGFYSVVVSNTAGTARSIAAELVVDPTTAPDALAQAWTLASGSRAYITGSNNQRGLAYNPVTKHLLLVNRATALSIRILDAATGADLGVMNTNGISGGTFILSKIEVADDGVIYACNFGSIGSATPTFNIYRWSDETSAPTLAYAGNPTGSGSLQWGNDMNIRGARTNTQIIVPSAQTVVAIFTTDNGTNFVSHPIATDEPNASMHRGVAFGEGNTFWTTSETQPLLRLVFDLDSNTAYTDQLWESPELPRSVTPIGVWPEQKLLAGLSVAAPDAVNIYDISTVDSTGPILQQSIPFPTDVANTLFAGSVEFGGTRLFVLDTNNGITAYDLPLLPKLSITRNTNQITLSWTGLGFRLQRNNSIDPNTWTDVTVPDGQTTFTTTAAGDAAFYRLIK